MLNNYVIVLFDGVCNLCNKFVSFIFKRDFKNKFRCAALQSETGMKLLQSFNLYPANINTIILIDGDKYFTKSSAFLRIIKKLGFPWSSLYFFIIIPPFVRDAVYNVIVKYRYNLFGKSDSCRIPTEEEGDFFL